MGGYLSQILYDFKICYWLMAFITDFDSSPFGLVDFVAAINAINCQSDLVWNCHYFQSHCSIYKSLQLYCQSHCYHLLSPQNWGLLVYYSNLYHLLPPEELVRLVDFSFQGLIDYFPPSLMQRHFPSPLLSYLNLMLLCRSFGSLINCYYQHSMSHITL